MNKSLTTSAILTAFSGIAAATELTLYGVVDTGFTYQHAEGGDDSFAMTSGNYAGPRFGFKGTEDLGDNLTLGFVLEAGFNSDTGTQGEDVSRHLSVNKFVKFLWTVFQTSDTMK